MKGLSLKELVTLSLRSEARCVTFPNKGGSEYFFFLVVLEKKIILYLFFYVCMSKCRQFKGLSTGMSILTIPNHTIKLQLHRRGTSKK